MGEGPKRELSEIEVRRVVIDIVYYTFQLLLELVPTKEEKMALGSKLGDMKLSEAADELYQALILGKLKKVVILHKTTDNLSPGKRTPIKVSEVINFLKTHAKTDPNKTLHSVIKDVTPSGEDSVHLDEKRPKMEPSGAEVRDGVMKILDRTIQLLLMLVPDSEREAYERELSQMQLTLKEAADKIEKGLKERKLQSIETVYELDLNHPTNENPTTTRTIVSEVIRFLRTHSDPNPNKTFADVIRDITGPTVH